MSTIAPLGAPSSEPGYAEYPASFTTMHRILPIEQGAAR